MAWIFFALVFAVSFGAALYSAAADPVTGATTGDAIVQIITTTIASAALPLTLGLVGLRYLRNPAKVVACTLMLPLLYTIAVKPVLDRTTTDFKPDRRSALQIILALPKDTFDLAALTVAHQRGFSFEHEDCPYRIALPSGSAFRTETGYRIGFARGMIGIGETFTASCERNDVKNEAELVEKARSVMQQNAGVSDPELIIRDGYVLATSTGSADGRTTISTGFFTTTSAQILTVMPLSAQRELSRTAVSFLEQDQTFGKAPTSSAYRKTWARKVDGLAGAPGRALERTQASLLEQSGHSFEHAMCPYDIAFPAEPEIQLRETALDASYKLTRTQSAYLRCSVENYASREDMLEAAKRRVPDVNEPGSSIKVHDNYIITQSTNTAGVSKGFISRHSTQILTIYSADGPENLTPIAEAFLNQARVFGSPPNSNAYLTASKVDPGPLTLAQLATQEDVRLANDSCPYAVTFPSEPRVEADKSTTTWSIEYQTQTQERLSVTCGRHDISDTELAGTAQKLVLHAAAGEPADVTRGDDHAIGHGSFNHKGMRLTTAAFVSKTHFQVIQIGKQGEATDFSDVALEFLDGAKNFGRDATSEPFRTKRADEMAAPSSIAVQDNEEGIAANTAQPLFDYEHTACPYTVKFPGPAFEDDPDRQSVTAIFAPDDNSSFAVTCVTYRNRSIEQLEERIDGLSIMGGQAARIEKHDGFLSGTATYQKNGYEVEVAAFFGPTSFQVLHARRRIGSDPQAERIRDFLDQSKVFGAPFTSATFLKDHELLLKEIGGR